MKKLLLIACITGASFPSISQVTWQKGGNNIGGGAISSLGTNSTWNAPLFFQTFGVNRMKLNGNYTSGTNQYAIDGFTYGAAATNINTSGYLLLGQEVQNGTFFNTKGAYSALHIQV